MSPHDALRVLKELQLRPRVAHDMLVDCSSESERAAVVDKALELLRSGIVKRVIVDMRAAVSQVAIMLHDPRIPQKTK
jgi:hypothetical protein